jgi:hypothetical protein
MAKEFPNGQFENWAKCEQLLLYVESIFEPGPADEESLKEWAQVLNNAAWYMWMKGNYKAVQDAAVKAVIAREGILGRDDQLTLTSIAVLDLVLQGQGKYDEAETLNRQVLEGREKDADKHG